MSFLPLDHPGWGGQQTVRVVQPGQRRIKIFVDFWNVIINARKQTDRFTLNFDWEKLARSIAQETYSSYADESSVQIVGCYVFGSYAKSNAKEHAFINETLDRYGPLPGLFFEFKERVKKETSNKCPHCNASVSKSSELGIDVLLTVEMIKHASMREHEFLALVSSDRDYIPLLNYLKDQGQRVIHTATGEAHRDMRSVSWKQIRLDREYAQLCSILHEGRLILVGPQRSNFTAEAVTNLEQQGLSCQLIDLTDPEAINDKDLKFLLANQSIYFEVRGDHSGSTFPANMIAKTLSGFREAVKNGVVTGPLPYVMYGGQMEAYADSNGNWIRGATDAATEVWAKIRQRA